MVTDYPFSYLIHERGKGYRFDKIIYNLCKPSITKTCWN